jgi:peptide/nickel transport system permease protein
MTGTGARPAVERVTSTIVSLIPGGGAGARRGTGVVFAAAFYLYGVVLVVRVSALLRLWAVDGWAAGSIVAAWAVLYAAAVGLPKVARPRRAARAFDRRFRGNATAVVGFAVLLSIVCASILAPVVGAGDPTAQREPVTTRYRPPSSEHPLGTDKFGRDVWTRVLYGARTSLSIAFASALLAALLGTLYGAASGMAGRRLDEAMMRVVDGLLAFPRLVFVLTLVALFPNSTGLLVAALSVTGWMGVARLVRGEVLRIRERDFAQAALASGVGRTRLLSRHLLPNAVGPVLVAATLNVGALILLESYLSFLGLGVQPPAPSWGGMVFDGRVVLLQAWWVAAFPAVAITLAVVAVNLIGDGVRDALQTRPPA